MESGALDMLTVIKQGTTKKQGLQKVSDTCVGVISGEMEKLVVIFQETLVCKIPSFVMEC
ncbi:hypothetical protein PC116_g10617 [Phytophthora cactorum]|nr:hypothetical protein PC116_g10617 [Phytophthora cactorum]